MIPKSIQKALSQLGLSNLAIRVYSQVFTEEKETVSKLARELGIYRRRVYESLNELKVMGLIDDEPKIVAKSPATISALLKAKEYELNKITLEYQQDLPTMLGNFFQKGKIPDIRIFEGINKFRYLFNTILNEIDSREEIVSYNEGNDLYEVLDLEYFFDIWIEKRIERGIFIRILANGENSMHKKEFSKNKIKFRETKILPKTDKNLCCYWVIGSKIILWDTQTPKAFMIENPFLAIMFKNQFELGWERLGV